MLLHADSTSQTAIKSWSVDSYAMRYPTGSGQGRPTTTCLPRFECPARAIPLSSPVTQLGALKFIALSKRYQPWLRRKHTAHVQVVSLTIGKSQLQPRARPWLNSPTVAEQPAGGDVSSTPFHRLLQQIDLLCTATDSRLMTTSTPRAVSCTCGGKWSLPRSLMPDTSSSLHLLPRPAGLGPVHGCALERIFLHPTRNSRPCCKARQLAGSAPPNPSSPNQARRSPAYSQTQ